MDSIQCSPGLLTIYSQQVPKPYFLSIAVESTSQLFWADRPEILFIRLLRVAARPTSHRSDSSPYISPVWNVHGSHRRHRLSWCIFRDRMASGFENLWYTYVQYYLIIGQRIQLQELTNEKLNKILNLKKVQNSKTKLYLKMRQANILLF